MFLCNHVDKIKSTDDRQQTTDYHPDGTFVRSPLTVVCCPLSVYLNTRRYTRYVETKLSTDFTDLTVSCAVLEFLLYNK